MLSIKILSILYPERYLMRRIVTLAQQELLAKNPGIEMEVIEINDAVGIGKYSSVIILPTLVINEKVVSSGCFPTREEVIAWLNEAMDEEMHTTTAGEGYVDTGLA